ncbi:MAG: pitrilysin family protein [Calditrichia bacterium]
MISSEYQKTILPNGLTIVSEKIPTVRSVTVGVWIKAGSRHESRENSGVAHFLEHMLFKGTEKRSAREIARSLESVGGYLNAYTSKEHTCYYAEVLDRHLPRAIEVLSDMLCHSVFSPKEMAKEREVILDEIDSVEDTPDDLIQEIFVEKLYPDNTLGLPILGIKESVSALTRDQLVEMFSRSYTAENIVVAAAGNLDHHRLVELCEALFDLPEGNTLIPAESPQTIGKGELRIERPVNQTHICLGTAALPYTHHRKYDLLLLNTLLGVGMGSRLFQNIRERYGLAYSIYSFLDFFRDNGLIGIYLGTDKNKTDKALNLLEREIQRLKTKPVSQKELKQVKTQVKGNLLLGLESTARRMSRLAKMEIYFQKFYTVDEIIAEINKVSQESLFELVNQIFDNRELLQVMFIPQEKHLYSMSVI